MIKNFSYYVKKGDVKKSHLDISEARALISKAKRRLERAKDDKITPKNTDLIFEDAYEVIRESAQSLMSIKGYKPYSHEATISFVKTFYKEFSGYEINAFNRFRKLRNDSVYKVVIIGKDDAREVISFAEKFLKKVSSILTKKQIIKPT